MKRFFFTTILLCQSILAISQINISGKVFDNTNSALYGAIVSTNNGKIVVTTDKFGYFELSNLPPAEYSITVSYVGFDKEVQKISLTKNTQLTFELNPNSLNELDGVIIRATRASDKTPVAYSTVKSAEIQRNNTGQDVPYILKNMPSVVITSDAGAGVGYSQMWIRGTDLTRINVTIDGIPMNDPESHSVYWVNIPDFSSSLDNIQIQRGVGVSTNGAGAFGATVNLKTNRLHSESYAEITNGYGSFNTIRNSVKLGSGKINDHFVFDARLSRQTSDGYIDRARSNLKSFYLSGTYFNKKTMIKATIFSGFEETYQAWNGVPKYMLDTNRTFNKYTYDNEIDHYVQSHYHLRGVHKFSDKISADLSTFYIKGQGYFEQYKENQDYKDYGIEQPQINGTTVTSTDLIRRKWLDNDFFGINYNVIYDKNPLNVIIGGSWSNYLGNHYGDIIWLQYAGNTKLRTRWYQNAGIKADLNSYAKISYNIINKLNIYTDLQYHLINYSLAGIKDNTAKIEIKPKQYGFFNPKFGVLFNPNNTMKLYLSFAVANREPRRSDFVDAPDNKIPLPERLFDYELGYKLNTNNIAFEANLYYMDYKNQLILTGEINDVGDPIYTNTAKSYRQGIELIFSTHLIKILDWSANVTLSQNKIDDFTEHVDNWSYWDDPANQDLQIDRHIGKTNISFSPEIIANSVISIKPLKFIRIDFASHYVARQYIDNTSNKSRSIDPYLVNDIQLNFEFNSHFVKKINLSLKINNIFNEKYETNAWVYSYFQNGTRNALDGYFPQAGINYMINLSLNF